jgi:hypothetical protein
MQQLGMSKSRIFVGHDVVDNAHFDDAKVANPFDQLLIAALAS